MAAAAPFAPLDVLQIGKHLGVDLTAAFAQLQALYSQVDAHLQRRTADLQLPCHKGCSACCHTCVFLTPLEFLYAWHWAQESLPWPLLEGVIAQGLAQAATWAPQIAALNAPPPAGEQDHWQTAKGIAFACPWLSAQGHCQIYPARELLARLFGSCFAEEGEVYGCHLVTAHLLGKTVTLPRTAPFLQQLKQLPLTDYRQIYPYYFQIFFS